MTQPPGPPGPYVPPPPPQFYVAPQPPPKRRLSWPVIGLGVAVIGLITAMILALTGVGSGSSYADYGYFPGGPIAEYGVDEPDDYDYDYGYGNGYGGDAIDVIDAVDQELALELLLAESGITGLTDLCADLDFGSIDISGSADEHPDEIEYWGYDGWDVYEYDNWDEYDDVRFDPYEYSLSDYTDQIDEMTSQYAGNGGEAAMVCITTELGDGAPRAAYYFWPGPGGSDVVYLDVDDLSLVYEE